ncbi:MAG TPA: hypothetical protein VGG39_28620 [Polyangiaceae bacterium]|jgi:hypothetical protein
MTEDQERASKKLIEAVLSLAASKGLRTRAATGGETGDVEAKVALPPNVAGAKTEWLLLLPDDEHGVYLRASMSSDLSVKKMYPQTAYDEKIREYVWDKPRRELGREDPKVLADEARRVVMACIELTLKPAT